MKVALTINSIAPARVSLYSGLAEHFDLCIFHGGAESNRRAWEEMAGGVKGAEIRRMAGWQIRVPRFENGRRIDTRHIHLNPMLFWELVKLRPDAVITNEMGLRSAAALLYGLLFRAPVWIWWGGTLHSERGIGAGRKLIRTVFARLARRWISYGDTSTEYLRSIRIDRSRIVQIQNSVDEAGFMQDAPAREFELERRPVVLCVGQLIARKGITLLLEAAAVLHNEGEIFTLLLVGDGPDRAALEAQAQSLGLENVEFHTGRKPGKMRAVYASADALVFPTLEDVWGLVANEAILSGLPVLCSRYAGCAEELFPPECVFDPLDGADFAAKLRNLIHGEIAPVSASRLLTTRENVRRIVSSVWEATGKADSLAQAGRAGSRTVEN